MIHENLGERDAMIVIYRIGSISSPRKATDLIVLSISAISVNTSGNNIPRARVTDHEP